MPVTTTEQLPSTLEVVKIEDIDAPVDIVWESLLEQVGPGSQHEDGKPMPMVLEAWPGGRWYRDLGNKTGHFWGNVQVIKPPKLLEICGPMFMSYAAMSHVQYRLAPQGTGTQLKLVHTAIGLISDEHRKGVHEGWTYELAKVKSAAERRAKEAKR